MVESSALLKRRSPKGYRGFESLPHRFPRKITGRVAAQRSSITTLLISMTFGIDLACGFRVLEERAELSINAIPQTPVICVIAYF